MDITCLRSHELKPFCLVNAYVRPLGGGNFGLTFAARQDHLTFLFPGVASGLRARFGRQARVSKIEDANLKRPWEDRARAAIFPELCPGREAGWRVWRRRVCTPRPRPPATWSSRSTPTT